MDCRRLQKGESLGLPHPGPMPSIGAQCHELRINDENQTWRIVYHLAADAVVILDVFSRRLPRHRTKSWRIAKDALQLTPS
jgi:phage-related protein